MPLNMTAQILVVFSDMKFFCYFCFFFFIFSVFELNLCFFFLKF